MSVTIILVPYHTGLHNQRVGAGPQFILKNNLIPRLLEIVKTVTVTEIEAVDEFEGEIGRSFELLRRVSIAVTSAVRNSAFPLILAGNCNTTTAVAAGLMPFISHSEIEVLWLDAHSDLDTPDEALSGYFDGMGVSMLTGSSWKALMSTVPGHQPLALEQIIYCGVRDLSSTQRQKLDGTPARVIYGNEEASAPLVDYATRLDEVLNDSTSASRAQGPCLVHLDLDCLDMSLGQANEYAAPGGLNEDDLLRCFHITSLRRRPVALTVASFNPNLTGGKSIADISVNAIVYLISRFN